MAANELASFRQALATSRPEAWSPAYAPAADDLRRDRLKWTLRFERRAADGEVGTSATTWLDGAVLPKELARVTEIANQGMTRALKACR
jgi:hypothetical protein